LVLLLLERRASRQSGLYLRRNKVVFAFPTNDGLFAVFIGWPIAQLPTVRADIEAHFMAALDEVPELAERVRSGRREERFAGAIDVPNFLRKPYGQGWALVGDAGCHKDPYLALGVCDAFRDAELLAQAVDDGRSGRCPLDAALAEYERRRNEATMRDYRENLQMAQFTPMPEEVYRLRAALRGNQEDTNRFFMARQDMIPPESFFNSENLQRIMGSAPIRTAGAA
jgi:flavin-dependent dehydrogenase